MKIKPYERENFVLLRKDSSIGWVASRALDKEEPEYMLRMGFFTVETNPYTVGPIKHSEIKRRVSYRKWSYKVIAKDMLQYRGNWLIWIVHLTIHNYQVKLCLEKRRSKLLSRIDYRLHEKYGYPDDGYQVSGIPIPVRYVLTDDELRARGSNICR